MIPGFRYGCGTASYPFFGSFSMDHSVLRTIDVHVATPPPSCVCAKLITNKSIDLGRAVTGTSYTLLARPIESTGILDGI